MRSLHVISIGALLIALLEMPYGYYQLLRVGICIASGILAYQAFEKQKSELGLAFVASALIYNPIAPLALGREIWTVVNIATIAVLIWSYASLQRSKPEP